MKTSSMPRWTIVLSIGVAILAIASEAMGGIPVEKLPAHVRRNLLSRMDPGQIQFIEKEWDDKRVNYRVYHEVEGEQRVMLLARNGLILKTVALAPDAGTLEDMLRAGSDTQRIKFEELPDGVREKMADRVEHILEIRQSVVLGRVVYDFKLNETSPVQEIRMARDGPVLRKTFAGVMPMNNSGTTMIEAAGAERAQKK